MQNQKKKSPVRWKRVAGRYVSACGRFTIRKTGTCGGGWRLLWMGMPRILWLTCGRIVRIRG